MSLVSRCPACRTWQGSIVADESISRLEKTGWRSYQQRFQNDLLKIDQATKDCAACEKGCGEIWKRGRSLGMPTDLLDAELRGCTGQATPFLHRLVKYRDFVVRQKDLLQKKVRIQEEIMTRERRRLDAIRRERDALQRSLGIFKRFF